MKMKLLYFCKSYSVRAYLFDFYIRDIIHKYEKMKQHNFNSKHISKILVAENYTSV